MRNNVVAQIVLDRKARREAAQQKVFTASAKVLDGSNVSELEHAFEELDLVDVFCEDPDDDLQISALKSRGADLVRKQERLAELTLAEDDISGARISGLLGYQGEIDDLKAFPDSAPQIFFTHPACRTGKSKHDESLRIIARLPGTLYLPIRDLEAA